MHKLLLTIAPDAVLEKAAKPVRQPAAKLKPLAAAMRHMMHRHDGIGLAAPQVGLPEKLAVLELKDPAKDETGFGFTTLVNPKIIWKSKETDVKDEGCLSLPGILVDVERSTKVRVRTQTPDGKERTIVAEGLFARALQHEIDHLNGFLITKRAVLAHPLSRPPRVLFFGSAPFSVPALEILLHHGYPVVGVVTESPQPSGRGQRVHKNLVHQLAEEFKLPVFTPSNLNEKAFEDALRALEPDLGVVVAYGKLIPASIFLLPTYKTINIHPSLLPRYRGPAPIQQALLDGEKSTGVTIMLIDEGLDSGPVLSRVRVPIGRYETGLSLSERLSYVGAQLLHATIAPYLAGKRKPKPQPKEGATYTKKLKKEDGQLDFAKNPSEIVRLIRALQPWPGAYTHLDNQRLKIWQAHVEDEKLVLDIVQLEGKIPMSFEEFIRGYKKPIDFLAHPVIHSSQKARKKTHRNA